MVIDDYTMTEERAKEWEEWYRKSDSQPANLIGAGTLRYKQGENVMERTGTRDWTGETTKVRVQWEGEKGTMEFWQSYPSFSPKGVQGFEADHPLTAEEVEKSIAEWEEGGGLSFPETM